MKLKRIKCKVCGEVYYVIEEVKENEVMDALNHYGIEGKVLKEFIEETYIEKDKIRDIVGMVISKINNGCDYKYYEIVEELKELIK